MKAYDSAHIRNVVLLAHVGTGKTSVSEAAAFVSGATNRLGRVEDGSTISDFEPEEARRHMSINLAVVPVEWNGVKVNLLDAPGYSDFLGEMKGGASAADAAVILVDGPAGVQIGTEQAWKVASEQDLPRLFLVNRMDRENADFTAAVAGLQRRFGSHVVPIELPIGSFQQFKGVVDLVTMKAYTGEKSQEGSIPDDLATEAQAARDAMIEAAAEGDDDLINKYLEGGELTEEEIRRGLREAFRERRLFPVLAGAATRPIGVDRLLDTVVDLVPPPTEGRVSVGRDGAGKEVTLSANGAGPVMRVFKTTADPFVGKLTYFRVESGSVHGNLEAWNPVRNKPERIGQLFYVHGKTQEPAGEVPMGDIAAVAKLAETATGDTLCLRDHPVTLAAPSLPEGAHRAAVAPKSKADLDKLGQALSRMAEEDPTLHVVRDPDTAETLLVGMGDTHLEIAAEKMKRKFGVDVVLQPPRIAYKETITRNSKAEYTHKKQTGGHGQYAKVALEVEPLPRGTGLEFKERVFGGAVPKQYIPAVEKGVHEAASEGVLARYPLIDVRATLYDGKEHPVDSSEMSFKLATIQAIKEAVESANPVLLEPIVTLRVDVPEEYVGDVTSDLNGKRARVHGMNPSDGVTTIDAEGPLAELQHYAADLRSLTQGRGTYHLEFSHYEEVPPAQAKRIIDQAHKEREAVKA